MARARTGRRAQKLNPVQQLIKSISDQAQKVPRMHHLPPARPAPLVAPAHTSALILFCLYRCARRSSSGTSSRGMAGSAACRFASPLLSTPRRRQRTLCVCLCVYLCVCVCVCDCSRANSCTCLWVTLCLAVCVCGCPLELANAVAPPKTNPTRLLCACTAQPPLARVYSHALTPSPALPAALRALQLQQQYAVTSTSSQFSVSGLGYTVWFRG